MFERYDTPFFEHLSRGEHVQTLVHHAFPIGRVEKDMVKPLAMFFQELHAMLDRGLYDFTLIPASAEREVLVQHPQGSGTALYKDNLFCTPAQCFNAQSTGAGKEIQYLSALKRLIQDIEDCPPDLV